VHIFIAIIFLMLLIASINYMNLATARSTRRSREIGIRKVAGSSRVALMRQFLTESVILAILALIISLVLCFILLPLFNNISGKEIDILYLTRPGIIVSIIGIVLFTGLVGGSYPAFFLSSFRPVNVLKGVFRFSGSNLSVRKILVILQFTLSTAMVISTWIVYDQLNYLKNKEPGFDKDNVVILQLTTDEMSRQLPVFKNNLLTNPRIISVGSANTRIGFGSGKNIFRVESPEGMVERGINNFQADHDFIRTVGIKLIAGRDFSFDRPEDTTRAVIINETLAKRLNWDEPIGKKVQFGGDTINYAEVVGLIGDYFQFGLYNAMESIMFLYYPTNYVVFVKVSGEDLPGTLNFIEEQWKELYPGFPFDHSFLDESFDEQFKADEKRGIIFTFFSVLTVLIACLGLFGLASFVAEMKTKEIGIRKVHGAEVNSIISMMLRSFMILIIISIVIASVASYFFAKDWLESFVYRTDIRWISFVSAAVITLVITIITVGLHTLKASSINPAESLRYE
jgi:putative ABC transport system permease protein